MVIKDVRKELPQLYAKDGGKNKRMRAITEAVQGRLVMVLPRYMVPGVYVADMSRTVSGKKIGSSFSVQQLAEMRTAGGGEKRQPTRRRSGTSGAVGWCAEHQGRQHRAEQQLLPARRRLDHGHEARQCSSPIRDAFRRLRHFPPAIS